MFKKSFAAKFGAIVMVAALVLFSDAASAVNYGISVNFAGGRNNGANTGGTDETPIGNNGPAGVHQLGNWNDAIGAGALSPLALNDSTGASTGSSVSWSVGNTWASSSGTGTNDEKLMKGYLDNFGGNSLEVSGLSQDFTLGGYSVLVYFNVDQTAQMGFTADDGVNSDTRFGRQSGGNGANFPLAGPNGYIVSTDMTNAFDTATPSNVILLEGLTGDSFTLTGVNGSGAPGSGNRARINGFQIVTTVIPEPTTAALGLLGMAGLARRRRRLA